MAELVKQDSEKEDYLNKLADPVVSEERSVSDGQVAIKEEPVIVNAANVRDAVADISYLFEDALTAIMTLGVDNGNSYGDSGITAMVQAQR